MCVCVCVCVCVRARVLACVRACAFACVGIFRNGLFINGDKDIRCLRQYVIVIVIFNKATF